MINPFYNKCTNCLHREHDNKGEYRCKEQIWPASGVAEMCNCPTYVPVFRRSVSLDDGQNKDVPRRIPAMPKEYTDYSFLVNKLTYPKTHIAWVCLDCERDGIFYEGRFAGPCHRCGSPNTYIFCFFEQLSTDETYAL